MKVVDVPSEAAEVNKLLDEARDEDLMLRAEDGSEFMLVAADDFDLEIQRTRANKKLMELLDRRAREPATIPLEEVKRKLGLE